ncbi:MAG: MBL fold metallo-hydrolase, partial [Deltaproteobacteria bacterium]|nr:MBL fold metallo-hydrolase [Deltaproteobacteria bacterium]
NPSLVAGHKELWLHLPEVLKKHPARIIESLPNYRRPALVAWLEDQGRSSSDTLTIGDLLDLGFDPTRLKEITLEGKDYIIERLHARLIPRVLEKKRLLEAVEAETLAARIKNAKLHVNPPLLVGRDRGNAYVLRRKVPGIHWEEAVDQLQTVASLRSLNDAMRVDKIIRATVRSCSEWLHARAQKEETNLMDSMTYFVAWDLEANQPNLLVDIAGSYVESVWIA